MTILRTSKGTLIGGGFRQRLFNRLIDRIDQFLWSLNTREPVPPRSMRKTVTRLEDFFSIPNEYIAYFKLLGGLQMQDTVLDIGCSTGRFALRLLGTPHYFTGEYFGFDPHDQAVEWIQSHVSRDHPNFHFQAIDLFNGLYNPQGRIDPRTFSFPYQNCQFDFVFAWSVFSHMFTEETNNYLREISRVLKPGKKALVTFLLIDGKPATPEFELARLRKFIPKRPDAFQARWYHEDAYAYLYPDSPELIVAHQEGAIREAVVAADLQVETIHHGCWNRSDNYLSEQDILVISKKPAES